LYSFVPSAWLRKRIENTRIQTAHLTLEGSALQNLERETAEIRQTVGLSFLVCSFFTIKNGITLCHAHHPRKRAEEKRLEPLFKELVSVSKV